MGYLSSTAELLAELPELCQIRFWNEGLVFTPTECQVFFFGSSHRGTCRPPALILLQELRHVRNQIFQGRGRWRSLHSTRSRCAWQRISCGRRLTIDRLRVSGLRSTADGSQLTLDVIWDAVFVVRPSLRQFVFGSLVFRFAFVSLRPLLVVGDEDPHVVHKRLQSGIQCSRLRSTAARLTGRATQCSRLSSTALVALFKRHRSSQITILSACGYDGHRITEDYPSKAPPIACTHPAWFGGVEQIRTPCVPSSTGTRKFNRRDVRGHRMRPAAQAPGNSTARI